MWNWLVQNKEWLFSGAGLTALALIAWLIRKILNRQPSPVPANSVTQSPNITVSPVFNLPEMRPSDPPEEINPCDFWLEFHPTGSRALHIKNSGSEPAFDVVVQIPADGSGFKSDVISRLDNDRNWATCGLTGNFVYLEAIRKVLAQSVLDSVAGEEVRQIPVLITYRTRKQQDCEAHLEIRLPLKNGIQFALPQIQERAKRAPEELEPAEARPEQALDVKILEFLENGVAPGNRPFTGGGDRLFRASEIADALSVPKGVTVNRLMNLETQGRVRQHEGTLDNPAPYWSILRM